ncbi:MAG: hypothetical protein K1060chlam4_00768 [Candidatus Anoxychlamydiales bacterium]|nr:hypothetical protein [Candidatus Anoxychlamydiales bacterium]
MSSSSSPTFRGFDYLPDSLILHVNHYLEHKEQDAFSETCKRLNAIAKSNLAALDNLQYLENNMIPLTGNKIDVEKFLRNAVQKQDDAILAQQREEDPRTVFQKQQEANDAALKWGVDISDGKSVAHALLKRRILGVYRASQNLQPNSANAPIQSSDISYERTIQLRKEYLLGLYKSLYDCSKLKSDYETLFKTKLQSLESLDLDDPTSDTFTTLFNRIKIIVIIDSFKVLYSNLKIALQWLDKTLKGKGIIFDNQTCMEFIRRFHSEIRPLSNAASLNKIIYLLQLLLISNRLPESFFHIWKTEFFDPFFYNIPKDQIFDYLTEKNNLGYTLLHNAAIIAGEDFFRDNFPRMPVRAFFKRVTENGNPLFIKFLLKQLDEGRRLDALNVVVDDEGTTIFQKILQTTRDLNLIKTILETVFNDPKEMTNYVKDNINAFQLELPRDKHLTDWIGTLFRQEIDSRFSDMNNGELFFYLKFYLASRDGKGLLYVLRKITDAARRVDLILRLFATSWPNLTFYKVDKVIYKQDLIKFLNLIPDNPSKAKFLELTNYYLITKNEGVTSILRKEIHSGNYQYFEGLVLYGSIDHIAEFVDTIPQKTLKSTIRKNFSLDQAPDVIRLLLSKLNKDEQISLIKRTQLVPSQIAKHNLYKLLYDLDILYESLSCSNVYKTGNPNPYSLMHCLVNAAGKELKNGGLNLKDSLSYVLEKFAGKDRLEVIKLLRTRVNRRMEQPTIFDKLIALYPESKAKIEAMFPGIEKEMHPKRKRSDESEEIDETARREDDSKKPRDEDPEIE